MAKLSDFKCNKSYCHGYQMGKCKVLTEPCLDKSGKCKFYKTKAEVEKYGK